MLLACFNFRKVPGSHARPGYGASRSVSKGPRGGRLQVTNARCVRGPPLCRLETPVFRSVPNYEGSCSGCICCCCWKTGVRFSARSANRIQIAATSTILALTSALTASRASSRHCLARRRYSTASTIGLLIPKLYHPDPKPACQRMVPKLKAFHRLR